MLFLFQLLSNNKVRLVVIDSFAAICRTEFSSDMSAERSKHLATFGSKLKTLSDQYDCPIVCVNQVSDNFKSGGGSPFRLSANVVPALGLAWSNTINTRLMLSRWNVPKALHVMREGNPESEIERELEIVFAPHLPQSRCKFRVTEEGVAGCSD